MKKYFFLFIFSISIFFFHAAFVKHAIYGDGNGYYVYTQSIYFDHELNSPKILDYLGNFQGTKYIFSRIFWDTRANPYLIGPGLVWIPSMLLMNIFSSNRFDIVHELGPGITGVIFMLAGLYFLEKYLRNFFSQKCACYTILIIFFGSNVLYYTAFEPALSHQPAFFLISFLLYWTFKFRASLTTWFFLGILSGLMAIVRPVDTILLIPILFQALKSKPTPSYLVLGFIGMLIAVSPQLYNQYRQFGSILTSPYLTGQNGNWQLNFFHTFEYLFSPVRGLFTWSPILLLGFIGIIKNNAKMFLLSIILLWLVTSFWSAYLSAGFGQRYSFSAIPYFAYGVAYIFNKMNVKKIVLLSAPFILWNLILLANFYIHNLKLSNSLSLKEFVTLQVQTPFDILRIGK